MEYILFNEIISQTKMSLISHFLILILIFLHTQTGKEFEII